MKVRVVPGAESIAGCVRAVEQGVRRRQRGKLAGPFPFSLKSYFFPISKVFPSFREVQLVSDISDCPCFTGVICGAIRSENWG